MRRAGLCEIHIDNNADAVEDITFQWRFTTEIRNPGTFLSATRQVTSLDDPDLNVRQFYRLVRVDGPRRTGAPRELHARLPVTAYSSVFPYLGLPQPGNRQ